MLGKMIKSMLKIQTTEQKAKELMKNNHYLVRLYGKRGRCDFDCNVSNLFPFSKNVCVYLNKPKIWSRSSGWK